MKLPKALQNPELRFFLANKKRPIEKKWNSVNNYPFFHTKMLDHIKRGGNYGVCGGFGNLIILDFDDWDYYKQISSKLPLTFTVQTANKKTYHKYFYLKGQMFKKIGIDIAGKRVCDIQAAGSGVIGPESRYNRIYYTIRYNDPIAEIPIEQLVEIFHIQPRVHKKYDGDKAIEAPEKVLQAIKVLGHQKIERVQDRHFKCPFHPMSGNGNLYIFPDGALHCFHCSRHWRSVHDLVEDLTVFKENGNKR